jgi:hypothetical protein
VQPREALGEAVGLAVHDEVDLALAIERDVFPRCRATAENPSRWNIFPIASGSARRIR